MLTLPDMSWSAEVVAIARSVQIDGVLEEWGAPRRIPLAPAGKQVGLRGAFEGPEDHEVDLYLMWDADLLYVGVVVEDDTLDVGRVGPGENVWEGPGGQRKDKMFYYDHLKVFVRGPDAELGYNVWISPSDGARAAYIWGAQQRGAASEDLPARAGSAWGPGIYTYELAIPWQWLDVHPQSEMKLDALFLLPDSDLPGLALEEKIARGNKWIWWQGKIQLQGNPPGLKPPPVSVVERIEEGVKALRATLPQEVKARVGPKAAVAEAQPDSLEKSTGAGAEKEPAPRREREPARADDADTTQVASASSPYLPDLAALNRRLAPRAPRAVPVWVKRLSAEVPADKATAFFRNLTRNLYRLHNTKMSSRIDVLIADMAGDVPADRLPARQFMIDLLGRVLEDLEEPGGALRQGLAAAAGAVGIEEEQAVKWVQHTCSPAKKFFEKHEVYLYVRVPTTDELLEKGRRKARLSPAQGRELSRVLVRDWAQ